MSYKQNLTEANEFLAKESNCKFIGYGLMKGRALGTLKAVPDNKLIEMPVAENLMLGFAIGLSIAGKLPVVFIERMDFIHNAMDAIVNHLDKINLISRGEFSPAVIIRCVVGNKSKPLYTGITHIQDYSEGIRKMVGIPIFQLKSPDDIKPSYLKALENAKNGISTILVEYKDLA